MQALTLTKAATYERRVPVPVARIWENVFDFEHLPWLHNSSFCEIRCLESGPWGWRAELRQTAYPDRLSIMEIRVERDAARYVSHILSGFGEGTEIWTHLRPVDDRQTDVHIEFNLPIADREKAERIGTAYRQLYDTLWTEDIEMMLARQQYLDRRPEPAKATVSLGTLDAVRGRLPLPIVLGEERFRIVEVDGTLMAYACLCPHMQGPLDEGEMDGSVVTCPWHGYRFDIATGHALDGRNLRLRPAPDVIVDRETGEVRLEWPEAE